MIMPSSAPFAPANTQTAVVQAPDGSVGVVSHAVPVPTPAILPHHVLVRVLAVALNPTDHKAPKHFPNPGATMGCDFCGVVSSFPGCSDGQPAPLEVGTRVCGFVYGYNYEKPDTGAFAEYVVADARLLLRVSESWGDMQAAALGGVGWGTVGAALWGEEALGLEGRPAAPASKGAPVLVYGGGTATGTMACQMLRLSGYTPIAATSAASAPLARHFGAVDTVHYTSPSCAAEIQTFAARFGPLRHALDCIADRESAAVCFAALGRSGGQYACLEKFDESWRTRRAVKVATVMGFERGEHVVLGPGDETATYARPASEGKLESAVRWTAEMQELVDRGAVENHPLREMSGGWEGIIRGLGMLRSGQVRGYKLVVRVAAP